MAYSQKKKIWLSPTGLETVNRCPRCFWLQYKKKLRQPEGIVSRLANRFDVIIKKYFDLYRPIGELPPLLEGKVDGTLQHPFQEVYFYHHDEDYGLMGKLDECLVTKKGTYTPVDHKTSSSDPNERPMIPAYQMQLDTYAFLLEKNNRPSSGIGHLLYFYPAQSDDLHNRFPMEITLKTLKTDPQHSFEAFKKAISVLNGKMPKPAPDCPFCTWHTEYSKAIKEK
ncbi:MAG: PD-(D/E)XK nuclease family protein [Candidatus Kerfeldbacteria bacterium]|nr:PD-(D/E)XK nuclease family protein [Candidatus Kerfeldbacteria bacterium]